MTTIVSVMRTEKKYSITWAQQNVLLHRLSSIMKTDANSDIGGYLVRSLYFDSIYDDDYFDKINGLESRKKIRLRIYSPSQHNAKLELKKNRELPKGKNPLLLQDIWRKR